MSYRHARQCYHFVRWLSSVVRRGNPMQLDNHSTAQTATLRPQAWRKVTIGKDVACEVEGRGHKGSACKHAKVQEHLVLTRNAGQPSATCTHAV